jgi:hypothetical protein
MSIWAALLWVGALTALVIVARAMGYRSRKASYRFGAAVAGAIFVLGMISEIWGNVVTAGILAVLALSAGILVMRRWR